VLGTPIRDRKAERRAETRREILEAAWQIARESGLNQVTLRDVATRVGMQAPSLYTHFSSKMAIFDAMFGQAWSDYEDTVPQLEADLPDHPREALHRVARHFYDFATADLARHQLMNQRIIPGFEPSPEAYAPSVRVLEHGRATVARLGEISADDFDIWVAIIGGLINQHHANDPGGTHYAGLLARAVDMWADHVGLPPVPRGSRRPSGRNDRDDQDQDT
jgi:AcrR family transcriptional regulator